MVRTSETKPVRYPTISRQRRDKRDLALIKTKCRRCENRIVSDVKITAHCRCLFLYGRINLGHIKILGLNILRHHFLGLNILITLVIELMDYSYQLKIYYELFNAQLKKQLVAALILSRFYYRSTVFFFSPNLNICTIIFIFFSFFYLCLVASYLYVFFLVSLSRINICLFPRNTTICTSNITLILSLFVAKKIYSIFVLFTVYAYWFLPKLN